MSGAEIKAGDRVVVRGTVISVWKDGGNFTGTLADPPPEDARPWTDYAIVHVPGGEEFPVRLTDLEAG
jgi:hypothetical protein